jgi:threonine/homoserine/homoserine lactone efflux protein
MDFLTWLQVLTICALGAMSPGPSLAVVINNTIKGGKRQGVLTGIGHGFGIFLYAAIVVTSLGVVLAYAPQIEMVVNYAGIILLLWLGYSFLGFGRSYEPKKSQDALVFGHSGFVSGFLIALFNPKIAAFFLALFAPVLQGDLSMLEKSIMAVTVGSVDALWFVFVAFVLSGSKMTKVFEKQALKIERMIGLFLVLVAFGFLFRLWS